MLVAQNSLGSVCPVPLTVRGKPREKKNNPLNALETSNSSNAGVLYFTQNPDIEQSLSQHCPDTTHIHHDYLHLHRRKDL